MQPIQINVQVTIGVSEQLSSLLMPLLSNLPAAPAIATPAVEKIEAAAEEQPAERQVEEAAQEPAPVEAEVPAQAQAEEPKKEYTEADVRAAMDATRKRIEGEDYKEKTDGEGYKKWHRVLTGWFKNTAAICGAEKPSALPDSDSRYNFIKCCDEVYVNDAGELTNDCPF